VTAHHRPEINCPSCGSALIAAERQPEITCTVCSGQFTLAGHLCPACARYHDEEVAACVECGSPLVRLCRNCQTTNWTGDEFCIACDAPIDLLSQVETVSAQSTSDRLGQQMLEAEELKEIEAASSEKRMAALMAIEEARQAELMQQRMKKQQHERRMLMIVFVAVMLFLLALIGYALVSASG
jgi:hypothetical protein